jgi:amidase
MAGIKVLEGLGAVIVPVQMPDMSGFMEAWGVLGASEALAAHEETYPLRQDDYGPWFRGFLESGVAVTGAQYAKANNVRAACRGLLSNVFENIDVIGCPTMTTPPLPITLEEMYGSTFLLDNPHWGRFTVPYDFNGSPSISLPSGRNSDGLPLSIQFVGKHLSEQLLCRIGHTFEQNTPWHNLRPDIE